MKKMIAAAAAVVLGGLVLFLVDGRAGAGSGAPGTVSDPLATKSYVDMKVAVLDDLIDTLDATASTSTGTGLPDSESMEDLYAYVDEQVAKIPSSRFEVVELEAGQKLLGGASTELILRGGAAVAITRNSDDGLSDLTDSSVGIQKNGNLINGESIPLNHLLLVPRDDGRGIAITKQSWVLVKGDYTIVD